MNSLDILFYTLSITVLLLVGILGYIGIHLVKTLKSIEKLINDMENISHGIRQLKNAIKYGSLQAVSTIFHLFTTLLRR